MSDTADNQPPVNEHLTPGSTLQRAREKRGWSVVDAAERMHLDPWAIEALEANRFDSVGPSVFAKGHLRQYALILGVPPADILADYEKRRQAAIPAEAPPPAPKQAMPAMPDAMPTPPTKQLAGVGGFIAIAVVAGVLFAWKPWRPAPMTDMGPVPNTGASAAPTTAAGPAEAAPGGSAQGAADSEPLPAPGANIAGANGVTAATVPPANAPGAARARLRLSFSADSWVEVREAGGAIVFRGKGAANSVKAVSGIAPLSVYLGYVSGVQLEINNRAVAIGPQFVHGDVAKFDAGADGVLRRSPRT